MSIVIHVHVVIREIIAINLTKGHNYCAICICKSQGISNSKPRSLPSIHEQAVNVKPQAMLYGNCENCKKTWQIVIICQICQSFSTTNVFYCTVATYELITYKHSLAYYPQDFILTLASVLFIHFILAKVGIKSCRYFRECFICSYVLAFCYIGIYV